MIEQPQSFIVATESQKAAEQNGFRRVLGQQEGWARFGSTTAPGTVYIAAEGPQGSWFLALDHTGVINELGPSQIDMDGPGLARYAFNTLGDLYALLSRVYQLAASLPDAPLHEFEAKTKNLPTTTEAERMVIQRVGQDIFRASLMGYWRNRCPLTGIADTPLLRASHIIPWKDCVTDSDRLDVHNGLLLSALWDAAFDRGLVTFDDDGNPVFSHSLSEAARTELRWRTAITLTDRHRERLVWHRTHQFNP